MKALLDTRVWEWQRFMHQQLWVYNGLSTAVCKDQNSQVSVWIKLCCKQKGAQVNGSWMLINWCHFSAVCHGDLAGLGTWSGVAGKELGQLFTFSNPPYSIVHLHASQNIINVDYIGCKRILSTHIMWELNLIGPYHCSNRITRSALGDIEQRCLLKLC